MRFRLEAAAVVLLLILLGLSVFNILYINRLTDELLSIIDDAETLADSGVYAAAAERVEEAADYWRRRDFYTHVTIRHSEVDAATDLFYELAGSLREESPGDSAGGFERLRVRLISLRDMERVSLKSVL